MVFSETHVPSQEGGGGGGEIGLFKKISLTITRRYQKALDDFTPWIKCRWAMTLLLAIFYISRVYSLGGWYIVSYALAIYILNLLIGFLSPKIDPEVEPNILPTKRDDEFRPFVRRLPEFKFWHATTRAFLIASFCTFIGILNIPVFWPILLIYFIALFGFTMKKQIIHMYKHRYIPFTFGKPSFKRGDKGKEKDAQSKK
eukprot:TRINITY_DN2408_c0_g1_i1.p1 TRINITY_DN2408_c0_g1~~TRINITY_DN2408_c0_g1_i1.p1  ORF type:complete len:200 (+),score=17.78 TRINITY_DN2408_c0_g1_i1:87-686(+)